MPRAAGPFQIFAKYGENAFKLELPKEYGVVATFIIGDLAPQYRPSKLRTTPVEEGWIDPNMVSSGES